MIILYFQLFVDVLCDDFQIITPDAIFKEIETNQLEMIDAQANCYEKQKFNLYIRSHHYGADDVSRNILEKNMLQFLKAYIAITGSSNFKITSNVCEKNSTDLGPKVPLEFFQNAWYYNQAVEEGYNTKDQIFKQYNYNIYRNLDSKNNFEKIYIENNRLVSSERSSQLDCQRLDIKKAFIDITLIDNCLNSLQDYECFYNGITKLIKNEYRYCSAIFVALNFTEDRRTSFLSVEPWKFFFDEHRKLNTDLIHFIDYYEERAPFGKYVLKDKNKSYCHKFFYWSQYCEEYAIRNEAYSLPIYGCNSVKSALSSLNCTIGMSCEDYFDVEKLFVYFDDIENFQYKIINIVHSNICYQLYIYYSQKLIHDIKWHKKILLSKVCLYFGKSGDKQFLFDYSYYKHQYWAKVIYLYKDHKGNIDKEMIEKHKKIVFLIQNLKTLLNRSFLHYNLELKLRNVIIDNILCVNYCKSLYSKKACIPWNYENKEVSIVVMLSKIQNNLNSKFKYALYSYQLKQKEFCKDLGENKQIMMFKYVTGLREITGKYIQNESKQIEQLDCLCLEISLVLDEYTQYYYLFLPIYEFRFATHKTNYENAILEFKNLLNNSKTYVSNELPPNIVDLYIDVINEFIEINNIPLKTLLLYFYNLNDEKIDFLIYTIIAIKAKKSGCLANVYKGLTEQELDIYDKLKIPYIYDEIKLLKDSIYGKFFEDLHFKLVYNYTQHVISDCLQKVAKTPINESNNKKLHYCYIQCGNDYFFYDKVKEIIECF